MNEIQTFFDDNKDKPFDNWLKFEKNISSGKQGIVGLLKTTKNQLLIFKLSQEIDNLIIHESNILDSLKPITKYCPNFVYSFGYITILRNPKVDTNLNTNPFKKLPDTKYMIKEEILIQEYLDNSVNLLMLIKNPKVLEDVLFSSVKQILLALAVAQKKVKFSHYDLHSLNVMMKPCDQDLVLVYKFDEENSFYVPTNGFIAKIIDCGFSFVDACNDGPLFTTLAHTGSGFLCDRYDQMVDAKLFLVTVSDEMHSYRGTKKTKLFRRIVKNMYDPLDIDFESGWDDNSSHNATDVISSVIEDYSAESIIFTQYEALCIDLLNSLIILPIQKGSDEDHILELIKIFKIFLKDWMNIERQISDPYYNLYILKGIIEAARFVRSDYYEGKKESVQIFKDMVFDRINEVTKFCMPKKINFERFLISLFLLSKSFETIYFNEMKTIQKCKSKQYNKIKMKNIFHIFGVIEKNVESCYVFVKQTKVMLINCVNDQSSVFEIDEKNISILNEVDTLCIGSIL